MALRTGDTEDLFTALAKAVADEQTLRTEMEIVIRSLKNLGENLLSRMFQELMIGDFVSYYAALVRGIDPTPVKAVQRTKDSA